MGLGFCILPSAFNTPLEMHGEGLRRVDVQVDALSILHWRCFGQRGSRRGSGSDMSFQYSIGDAALAVSRINEFVRDVTFNTPLEMLKGLPKQ